MARPARIPPAPGQESVWDYPRPPRLEETSRTICVVFNGVTIAETRRAWRVLETSHPPTYYLPLFDICAGVLEEVAGGSVCEWKGRARYYDIVVGSRRAERAAWSYPNPASGFEPLRDCVAFYASRMDLCTVDGAVVIPQPGGFYGGWITADVVGPFKGEPGTLSW